jgi:hypothetical protein
MTEDFVLFESNAPSLQIERVGNGSPSAPLAATDDGLQAVLGWFARWVILRRYLEQSCVSPSTRSSTAPGPDAFNIRDPAVGKTERTYLGTKVEIVTRATFELTRGPHGLHDRRARH